MSEDVRIERDALGEVSVPAGRMWGAQTQRAVENFQVSGRRMRRPFLDVLAAIKASVAEANRELGRLDAERADAIVAAADEVVEGRWPDEFPVDVFQTGSGTSTNMNMNEVIANLANGRLGAAPGAKAPIHPNDHVNLGQSSNDVIPTALHLSVAKQARERLLPSMGALAAALLDRSEAWNDLVKVGRTHLQDATPIRVGQVFQGYAAQVAHACQRIALAYDGLLEVALGGTAVGTGVGRHPDLPAKAIEHLARRTGLPVRPARNYCEQLAGREAIVFFAGGLGAAAAALHKVANDVRFLGSGPRCGIGELRLPAVQPGSSIMPGKVNPVMSESLIMACLLVQGYVTTAQAAGMAGHFELNVTLPLLADTMLDGIEVLSGAVEGFTKRCIVGLQPEADRMRALVEQSLMPATALAPRIGYDEAARIAKEAHASGRTILEVASARTDLPESELRALLDPRRLTGPG